MSDHDKERRVAEGVSPEPSTDICISNLEKFGFNFRIIDCLDFYGYDGVGQLGQWGTVQFLNHKVGLTNSEIENLRKAIITLGFTPMF